MLIFDPQVGEVTEDWTPTTHPFVAAQPQSDERHVVTVSSNGWLILWDGSRQRVLWLQQTDHQITHLATSGSHPVVATADGNGLVQIWDTQRGVELGAINCAIGGVTALALLPDGKHVAVGGKEGRLRLWNVESLGDFRTVASGFDLSGPLAYSPDGSLLAAADRHNNLWIWKTGDWQLLPGTVDDHKRAKITHRGAIRSISFAPDNSLVATSGSDGRYLVWKTDTGTVRHELMHAPQADGAQITFAPNGQHLATCGDDGTIKLWQATNGQLVRSWADHGCWKILSSSADRTIPRTRIAV